MKICLSRYGWKTVGSIGVRFCGMMKVIVIASIIGCTLKKSIEEYSPNKSLGQCRQTNTVYCAVSSYVSVTH